jgi:hypothetical protein
LHHNWSRRHCYVMGRCVECSPPNDIIPQIIPLCKKEQNLSGPVACQPRCSPKFSHANITSSSGANNNKSQPDYSDLQGNRHDRDKWTYIWGSTKYTSSKFYSLNFASIVAPTPFKWIWESKVSKKIKIFIRLLFRDRTNSKSILMGMITVVSNATWM